MSPTEVDKWTATCRACAARVGVEVHVLPGEYLTRRGGFEQGVRSRHDLLVLLDMLGAHGLPALPDELPP